MKIVSMKFCFAPLLSFFFSRMVNSAVIAVAVVLVAALAVPFYRVMKLSNLWRPFKPVYDPWSCTIEHPGMHPVILLHKSIIRPGTMRRWRLDSERKSSDFGMRLCPRPLPMGSARATHGSFRGAARQYPPLLARNRTL